jgi:hypothetical protein
MMLLLVLLFHDWQLLLPVLPLAASYQCYHLRCIRCYWCSTDRCKTANNIIDVVEQVNYCTLMAG